MPSVKIPILIGALMCPVTAAAETWADLTIPQRRTASLAHAALMRMNYNPHAFAENFRQKLPEERIDVMLLYGAAVHVWENASAIVLTLDDGQEIRPYPADPSISRIEARKMERLYTRITRRYNRMLSAHNDRADDENSDPNNNPWDQKVH